MLALAFLNPLLLWAVPLCSVPILIHLLNRRRFQRVPWAAMEFLLAALKRNRKRLRMEQWLVLLLRTLAVLLLAFLVARPQLVGGGLIGARTHHVVLLDDTASMSQRTGSVTLWDKAVDAVRQLADRLGDTRGGDLFSLVRTGRAPQPELWGQRVGPDLGRRVGAMLKEWPPGDGTMDLGAVLAGAHTRALETKEAGRTEYYLVTDLRSIDWLTEDDKPRPALQSALNAIDPRLEHLTAVAVGSRDADNLGIVAVRRLGRLTAVGVQIELAVDVQNHGLDASLATELSVEMDGKSRVVRPVPQLAPGEKMPIPVAHTFHAAGHHRIEASLPASDHYPLDDRRSLALPVQERSKALLVDGEPGESSDEGETMFLQVALDQTSELPTGIEPHVVTDAALAELDLSPYDVVYLCNVAAPAPAVVDKLEKFVTGGGGLVIYVGAQVDPVRYNEQFWRSGKGLLPLELSDIAGDPDRPDHLFLAQKDHPICGDLGDALEVFCNILVLIKRHLPMVEDPRAGAAVMARIRDAEGSPAIASKSFGSGGGTVVLFGFAADKHWSNWPDTPANLVVAQQTHRFATRLQDLSGIDLTTRGKLRLELDPGAFKPDVEVRALAGDGEERTFTAAAPAAAVPGATPSPAPELLRIEIDMGDLRTLGTYEVDLHGHGGAVEKQLFVRNVPVAESRLVRLAPADFARIYPAELQERVTFRDEGAGAGSSEGQGEIWRPLALAMLLALLVETLLAWRFGRR